MAVTFYVDVFPVNTQIIPPLFAYSITCVSDDLSSVGGKLAYRLRNKFGGNWIWSNGQIISDKQVAETLLKDHLKELWGKEDNLKEVQSVSPNLSWTPSAWEQGDFAARGLMANYQAEVRNILAPKKQNFGKIRIERDFNIRGWAVDDKPAISITVSSNIVHTQNLAEYAVTITDPKQLIGMMVAVSAKDFKGEIVEIAGILKEKREWLLSVSTDEMTRGLIKQAPDNELTVKIETRASKYIYISSRLSERPTSQGNQLVNFAHEQKIQDRQLRRNAEPDNPSGGSVAAPTSGALCGGYHCPA